MDSLLQDLRYGVRTLTKARGFSALAVVTLAVGIAATTGVFSIVNTVLLKPLPFADPDRLFMLYRENPKRGAGQGPFSYSAYQTVARHARSLSGVAAVAYEPFTLTRLERPEEVPGARVSSSFFSVLGIQPRAGRVFEVDDDRPGGPDVVVLSRRVWTTRFGGDPSAVGRTLTLNGKAFIIVG